MPNFPSNICVYSFFSYISDALFELGLQEAVKVFGLIQLSSTTQCLLLCLLFAEVSQWYSYC